MGATRKGMEDEAELKDGCFYLDGGGNCGRLSRSGLTHRGIIDNSSVTAILAITSSTLWRRYKGLHHDTGSVRRSLYSSEY
jgi:hypothetical protein